MKIYYARSAGTVSGPISNSFFRTLSAGNEEKPGLFLSETMRGINSGRGIVQYVSVIDPCSSKEQKGVLLIRLTLK